MSDTDPSKPRRPSFSAAARAITIVKVKQRSYYIHQDFLTHYSPYFRAALEGPFKDAEEGVMSLSNVSTCTFDMFVNWLYTQEFPTPDEDPTPLGDPAYRTNFGRDGNLMTENLIDLYIFADGHDTPLLRRDVINQMCQRYWSQQPSYKAIINTFSRLSKSSPLRRFLIDSYCNDFNMGIDDIELRALLPNDCLFGVMLRHADKILELNGDKKVCEAYALHPCDYHEHANTAEDEQCKMKRRRL
ncbi:hypothetical protein AOQ84DRAFT_393715 [Glonium stellatum]|uniref:BTB domain-containing protein n=1 Tax=Glonium stellatum TaxID=574774 RepID=A0A8E2EMI4_9PEZI|nr:hypothetical protein AOQ84DRAFT_393715 [Glonium stellatum]